MADRIVTVVMCERSGVYVDNTRITDRGTKWGVRRILHQADMLQSEVVEWLHQNGQDLSRIDAEPYKSQVKAFT